MSTVLFLYFFKGLFLTTRRNPKVATVCSKCHPYFRHHMKLKQNVSLCDKRHKMMRLFFIPNINLFSKPFSTCTLTVHTLNRPLYLTFQSSPRLIRVTKNNVFPYRIILRKNCCTFAFDKIYNVFRRKILNTTD